MDYIPLILIHSSTYVIEVDEDDFEDQYIRYKDKEHLNQAGESKNPLKDFEWEMNWHYKKTYDNKHFTRTIKRQITNKR